MPCKMVACCWDAACKFVSSWRAALAWPLRPELPPGHLPRALPGPRHGHFPDSVFAEQGSRRRLGRPLGSALWSAGVASRQGMTGPRFKCSLSLSIGT